VEGGGDDASEEEHPCSSLPRGAAARRDHRSPASTILYLHTVKSWFVLQSAFSFAGVRVRFRCLLQTSHAIATTPSYISQHALHAPHLHLLRRRHTLTRATRAGNSRAQPRHHTSAHVVERQSRDTTHTFTRTHRDHEHRRQRPRQGDPAAARLPAHPRAPGARAVLQGARAADRGGQCRRRGRPRDSTKPWNLQLLPCREHAR
jgi:hypothetical protein